MSYSADAAEQIVRMSLNGVEVAAEISGKAAERLAVLLYAVMRGQKKTRGKTRLTSMLRSGKELKVFAVRDAELQKFCTEAKKYGVLYCVLKDRNASDGLTDIMVRAEDASKINRIYERFNLATIDMGSVKTEIERARTESGKDKVQQFLDDVVHTEEQKTLPGENPENPTNGLMTKSRQSEPLSARSESPDGGTPERSLDSGRPSVRRELTEIREAQGDKSGKQKERTPNGQTVHQPPRVGKRKNKGERR